jgi:hypothetical protein
LIDRYEGRDPAMVDDDNREARAIAADSALLEP